MPEVTGTATETSAFFNIGHASAQFIDGDTAVQVLLKGSSHFTPDEARQLAGDLDAVADIATQLEGALQDGSMVDAFRAVCHLNGWAVDNHAAFNAARIRKGVEL